MVLEDKDILQIDATIIAGALVFLTISTVVDNRSDLIYRLSALALALSIIILFGQSAMFTLAGRREHGLSSMYSAFKYLVIMVAIQQGIVIWKLIPQIQFDLSNLANLLG